MTRAKRARRENSFGISLDEWAYLTDVEDDPKANPFFEFKLTARGTGVGSDVHRLWQAHRDQVLLFWVDEHPGTRPALWWMFDAPRQPVGTFPGCPWDGEVEEPRKRLGGIGTAENDLGDGGMACVPTYHLGLPTAWVSAWDAAYYTGQAVDVHGIPIGTEYVGKVYGEAVDREDPPIFESQAAYLGRLGQFVPGELQRLPKDAFEPERIDPPQDEPDLMPGSKGDDAK